MEKSTETQLKNFIEDLEKMEGEEEYRIVITHKKHKEILQVEIPEKPQKTVKTETKTEKETKTETETNQTKLTEEKEDFEVKITKILNQMGMRTNIKGFKFCRTALIIALEDKSTLNAITKCLYPAIAKKYDSTPSRVERAIRHAIATTWTSGNLEYIDNIFGYMVSSNKGRPTNSEFLALIVDDIEHKLI